MRPRIIAALSVMAALVVAAQAMLSVRVNLQAPLTLTQPIGSNGSVSCTFTGKFKHVGQARFQPDNYVLGATDLGSNTYQVTLTLDGQPLQLNVLD
jgi:hypothetical protein